MKNIRWKRIALIVVPFAAVALFPYLHRMIDPDFFSPVHCIKETPSGESFKATGAACAEAAIQVGQIGFQQ
jgi:hypothetical protein